MRLVRPLGSIRVRMALWYSVTLALALLIYASLTYGFLSHRLLGELDESLAADLGLVRQALDDARRDGRDLADSLRALAEEDEADRWIEIRSSDGVLLQRHFPPGHGRQGLPRDLAIPGGDGYGTVRLPGGPSVRVLQGAYGPDAQGDDGGRLLLRVGRSERQLRHELRTFLLAHGIGLPLAVLAAGLGGYLVTRRALAPVGRMARQARSITADRLGDRLPVVNPDDELGHLAKAFNDAFSRLEDSFAQLKRFTADASHELRTPLTALRSVGEVGLRGSHSPEKLREIIGSMLEEVDRMAGLVDGLLTIARTESGSLNLNRQETDLALLVREVAECLEVLAEEKRQELTVESAGPVLARVDRLVLRQALVNILDNAIKYAPEEGRVRIAVRGGAAGVEIDVEDTGPGIAPEHQERVFERFYRVDRGRAREHGGCGLGLAIAKWAVGAHGGRIELASAPGRGSVFRVVLPRVEESRI